MSRFLYWTSVLAVLTLATIGLRVIVPYPYCGFVFCFIAGVFCMFFFGAYMGSKGGENANSNN